MFQRGGEEWGRVEVQPGELWVDVTLRKSPRRSSRQRVSSTGMTSGTVSETLFSSLNVDLNVLNIQS